MFVSPDHGVLMQEYQGISSTGMCGQGGGGGRVRAAFERVLYIVLTAEALIPRPLPPTLGAKGFVGLQAPHLILNKPSINTSSTGRVTATHAHKVMMQGFAGMEDNDDKVRSALLEFSYNLAVNNMDEAFRAVKAIKSTSVWENMAHLCIKNKRLDVAGECEVWNIVWSAVWAVDNTSWEL